MNQFLPRGKIRPGVPQASAFIINKKSPQARRLVLWWSSLLTHGASTLYSPVITKLAGTPSGTNISSTVTNDGQTGISFAAGTGKIEVLASYLYLGKTAPFTISCSIIPGTYVSLANIFGVGQQLPGNTDYIQRYLIAYNNNYYFWGGNTDFDTGIAYDTDGSQHLLTVTSNGTTLKFYRDGIYRAQTGVPAAWLDGNKYVTVGSKHSSGASTGNFTFLEGRIYDRCLNDSEVWEMYDPDTRWDLYKTITQQFWNVPTAVPSGNPWYAYQQM